MSTPKVEVTEREMLVLLAKHKAVHCDEKKPINLIVILPEIRGKANPLQKYHLFFFCMTDGLKE